MRLVSGAELFLHIVLRSCVMLMPAAFESLVQWLGWPRRLAKHIIFCGASLSILVTWVTYFMPVHFFSVGGEVKRDNLVSNVLIRSTYLRKSSRLLFHTNLIETFHFPQIKSRLCELVAALSFFFFWLNH